MHRTRGRQTRSESASSLSNKRKADQRECRRIINVVFFYALFNDDGVKERERERKKKEKRKKRKEMMISQASCFWEERRRNHKTKGVYFSLFSYASIFTLLHKTKDSSFSLFFLFLENLCFWVGLNCKKLLLSSMSYDRFILHSQEFCFIIFH